MAQIPKKRNRKSDANPQQVIDPTNPDPTKFLEAVANSLTEYVKETDVPILAEYAANTGLYEELILQFAFQSQEISFAIKLLENKKRAALERRIYEAELNATIGSQLLKSWREIVVPEPPPKYRYVSVMELVELGLTDQEMEIYSDIQRKLCDKNRNSLTK